MSAKTDAQAKINTAEEACGKVQASWVAADKALSGSVGTNGYGIYRDSFELRNKLRNAQNHIRDALLVLDSVEFPTNADYDLL